MAGLQLVESKDAEYLAQRFGARPYDRIRTAEREPLISESDGSVGIAQGVRQLSLGQGLCSSWTYIFGDSDRWHRGGGSHVFFSRAIVTMGDLERGKATLEPRTGLACQVVLRAPTDGMLAEYACSVSRLLTLTLSWLEWDPPIHPRPQRTTAATTELYSAGSTSLPACPMVAGGGASEVSLHLLFKDLADKCAMRGGTPSHVATDQTQHEATEKRTLPQSWGEPEPPTATARQKDTKKGVGRSPPTRYRTGPDYHDGRVKRLTETMSCEPNADVDFIRQAGGGAVDGSLSAAFSVLAAAMSVLPDTLLENAFATSNRPTTSGSRNGAPGGGRATGGRCRLQFRHALDRLHSVEGQKSTGLVVTTSGIHGELVSVTSGKAGLYSQHPSESIGKGMPHLFFSCGLKAGVVQPLAVKYGTLVALLEAMTTSLRISGVVRCHRKLGRAVGGGGGTKSHRKVEDNHGDSSDDE